MTKQQTQIANRFNESLRIFLKEIRSTSLSPPELKKLTIEIAAANQMLANLNVELDPVKLPTNVFDPGNPRTVGFFVALALTAQPKVPLDNVAASYGSGIYALYYNGNFTQYADIKSTETPIYVGQASPANVEARTPREQGAKLTSRLSEHRRTIGQAKGSLDLADFECRFLVVQTAWETAAEDYLIRLFKPIWNKETKIIQGFGKHGDSATTRMNKVSSWDVLHIGRKAAGHGVNPDQKSVLEISGELSEHFKVNKVYPNFQSILDSFLRELLQK
jgi:Eco29kI restriction endonuclease